ncbi:Ger(x)C family spore germination protein [Fictibacillus barbaricus]|uniref:Ger(X)C family spore germination protein n=1 Tax=Fictibacillus barbaricus TaxID=182136 RepID=A0ABS2ZFW0_9BACL|nr:Ger(x)C family spore germination protein [Fictibacillus barbaricus]MBN3545509.1 Ger(x)C family spore germination protein [Fictibacillus barbaricus]GGB54004.1 spore germination protein KC [Fictibacillus barbaricus]
MKRIITILTVLTLLLSLTTGCWNRRELNELAITLAMGLDLTKDGKYLVTAQVVNPSEIAGDKGGGGGDSPVVIYQEKGETVFEAIRKMTKESPRKIYPSHLRMLIIGESLAKKGIGKPLDLLSRDWELRSDFYVAVSKGVRAEEVLKVPTSLEKTPANKMFDNLEVSAEAWSATSAVMLDELITDMVSPGKQPVLTGITADIKGDKRTTLSKQNVELIDTPAKIYFNQLAVFKKDKLIGWLNENQSKTYNIITNKEVSTVVNIPCPDGGKAVYQVTKSDSKVKGKIRNGRPEIDINIQVEGNVGEVECKVDLSKQETIDMLEKSYEKEKKEILVKSVKQIQEKYKVDIFGFGDAIHRTDPKAWSKLKKDWDKNFEDLKVNIQLNGEIRRVGTIGNSFLNDIK